MRGGSKLAELLEVISLPTTKNVFIKTRGEKNKLMALGERGELLIPQSLKHYQRKNRSQNLTDVVAF